MAQSDILTPEEAARYLRVQPQTMYREEARQEVAAAGYMPTHEEVRRMTARDSSCWSEAIIAERQERL